TNLIKESIRMGYNDIGDFFYAHGQLSKATSGLGTIAPLPNIYKAEQTPDSLDPIIVAKLKAAAGLANMETKKYKLAARKVNVAVYGALCALASFDRSDLKNKVIDNINFRNFLELVPEVRELVNDFNASRYGSCLGHLEKLKPNLLLDIHLHEHVESLYMDIRHKANFDL
ncbi:hypothetical protein ACJX0J_039008, partial [Zea mays]